MLHYRAARRRHAQIRAEAYEAVREDALRARVCGPRLHLADIGYAALDVWRATWEARHPWRAGGWDWERLVRGARRQAAVLPLAIWHGDDLCGLAMGAASRHRRAHGGRHTITLHFVERRAEPPEVPLRGLVIPLSIAVAEAYGRALRASRLRLWRPDPDLLAYYQRFGFDVVRENGAPVYCEREIE